MIFLSFRHCPLLFRLMLCAFQCQLMCAQDACSQPRQPASPHSRPANANPMLLGGRDAEPLVVSHWLDDTISSSYLDFSRKLIVVRSD